jgi:hypothetical protein
MKYAIILACAVICSAQSSGPDSFGTVRVDLPLRITLDPAGVPHLGLALVRGEVPPRNDAGVWTLAHAPIGSVAVYRNGIRQTDRQPQDPALAPDFTLTGMSLTSPFWEATDTIVCDYEYAR